MKEMGGPSYPEYVDTSLAQIRHDLHLRWNPHCKVVVPGGFDAAGLPIEPKYEPRFEVWDVDTDGVEYRIMIVQNEDSSFRMPDQRLVEWLNKINPANYKDGVAGVLKAMLLDPESRLLEVNERDFENFIEGVTRWYWDYGKTKSVVPDQIS